VAAKKRQKAAVKGTVKRKKTAAASLTPAQKGAITRARNKAVREREALAAAKRRSLSAKRAAATRAANKAARVAHAEKVRLARARGARKGWAKRRAKQLVISAFNDPHAAAFGLRGLRPENGRVVANDSTGKKRQLYTVTHKQTGEVTYRWGDANKLEGFDPKTFQDAYEDLDPEIYEVQFEFEI